MRFAIPLAMWGFIIYFIVAWGWWALVAIPAFLAVSVLVLCMSATIYAAPSRSHNG